MEFANKEYLLLLLLIIPYLIWYVMYRKKAEPTMRMSDTFVFRYAPRSWKVMLMPLSLILRLLAFTMIVLVLARPQTQNSWKSKTVEGIDIMLAMDVSTSMLAEDLKPNRIEAAKQVAAEFIIGRPNDNIGLTIFAGESFTQCPMTTDHASLLSLLQNVRTDIAARGLIEDGTAIGMGLANAVTRLKDSKAKSKVVILLTDGSNNRGDISPMTAAGQRSRSSPMPTASSRSPRTGSPFTRSPMGMRARMPVSAIASGTMTGHRTFCFQRSISGIRMYIRRAELL